jgi:hypothetical protein
MRYYGLIAGLPTPRPGQPLPFGLADLRGQLDGYLEGADRRWVHTFFYRVDWANAAALLQARRPSAEGRTRRGARARAASRADGPADVPWLEGGNLTETDLRRWLDHGPDPNSPFHEDAGGPGTDPADRLHRWWARYTKLLFGHPDPDLPRLVRYDVSLRNFQAGRLWRETLGADPERPARYLPGGWFDRFAYAQGQLGDIRAEHPWTAAVLATFAEGDPLARQEAMQAARLAFYEHVAFFRPFDLVGLAARLYAYTDRQALDLQDADTGRAVLDDWASAVLAEAEDAVAGP